MKNYLVMFSLAASAYAWQLDQIKLPPKATRPSYSKHLPLEVTGTPQLYTPPVRPGSGLTVVMPKQQYYFKTKKYQRRTSAAQKKALRRALAHEGYSISNWEVNNKTNVIKFKVSQRNQQKYTVFLRKSGKSYYLLSITKLDGTLLPMTTQNILVQTILSKLKTV